MSWRVQGKSLRFPKAAAQTTGTRKVGELVHLNNDGKATLTSDDIHFPLTSDFDATVDQGADAQVDGIAKVKVETFTSINVGSPLKPGATGVGAALAAAGEGYFGFALEKPAANGDMIPVLMVKGTLPLY